MSQQPTPFEIVEQDGQLIAANGGPVFLVALKGENAAMFKRRAIKGIATKTVADSVLPMLNTLAGDLVSNMQMPAQEVAARLACIAALADAKEPQRVETVVAEIDGVRAYFDGRTVILTKQDLTL